MKEYTEVLAKSNLFSDIAPADIEEIILCLNAKTVHYEKGNMVIWEGDAAHSIGIVLSGHARSIKDDPSGKTIIVTNIGEGDFVGVLLAASQERKSPVSVQALDQLIVILFPIDNVIGRCKNVCKRHDRLLSNFIDGIAEKALVLHDRNDCLIKPTVREKILTFLMRVSKEQGSQTFTIPMDRHAMSEYLNVERTALSRELSRMKQDGMIDFYKDNFRFL